MMLFSISLMINRTLYSVSLYSNWAPNKIAGGKSLIKPMLSKAGSGRRVVVVVYGGGGVVHWYKRMTSRVDSLALGYRHWGDVTLELWRIKSTKTDIIVNYIIIIVDNKFAMPQFIVRALEQNVTVPINNDYKSHCFLKRKWSIHLCRLHGKHIRPHWHWWGDAQ